MSTMCRLTLVSRFRILSVVLFFAVELAGLRFACPAQSGSDDVPYSVGSWSETLGEPPGEIQVTEKADAVWVHLPWRRHDRNLEKQSILIVDAATGKTIENVARVEDRPRVGRPGVSAGHRAGRILRLLFPLRDQPGYGWYAGDYLPPKATAVRMAQASRIDGRTDCRGGLAEIPAGHRARVPGPDEFERFDPMEWWRPGTR